VIEKAKAKHEVKRSEVGHFARFVDVFRTPVKPEGVKPAFCKCLREEAHAATRIHGSGKAQRGFQPLHDSPQHLLPL